MDTKLHTELKKDDPPLLGTGECLDRWIVEKMMSVGGFGQVFVGHHAKTGRRVAIKVESINATVPLLKNEAQCLQHVNACQNRTGDTSVEPFLHFYAFGKTLTARYLVMDLCGPNLRELKKATPLDRFSIKTSLWVMYKMVAALRHMHHNGWIHRDVKPANFCVGYGQGMPRLFLIDFGMCRYYVNRDGTLKPRKDYSAFHGTVRYASLNTHRRQDLCRFDDLWSVYYITCEHMMGALPWRMVTDKNEVMRMKEEINLSQYNYGEEMSPPACVSSLLCCLTRALQDSNFFYLEPDYEKILNEINMDLVHRKFLVNSPLDWEEEPVASKFYPQQFTPTAYPVAVQFQSPAMPMALRDTTNIHMQQNGHNHLYPQVNAVKEPSNYNCGYGDHRNQGAMDYGRSENQVPSGYVNGQMPESEYIM